MCCSCTVYNKIKKLSESQIFYNNICLPKPQRFHWIETISKRKHTAVCRLCNSMLTQMASPNPKGFGRKTPTVRSICSNYISWLVWSWLVLARPLNALVLTWFWLQDTETPFWLKDNLSNVTTVVAVFGKCPFWIWSPGGLLCWIHLVMYQTFIRDDKSDKTAGRPV